MSNIITFPNGRNTKKAQFDVDFDDNPADRAEIEENISSLNGKLPQEYRMQMATALGRFLSPLRKERGKLSGLMRSCWEQDKTNYTKHIGRYVIFPDKKYPAGGPKDLSNNMERYRCLATKAAKMIHPDLDEEKAESLALWKLVEEIPDLQPRRDQKIPLCAGEREIADSFSDLVAMLESVANHVITKFDMPKYFHDIARWSLISRNAGGTFHVEDHVACPSPEEKDFWEERSDLFPMIRLFDYYDDNGVNQDIATVIVDKHGNETNAKITKSHGVWFGIAPPLQGYCRPSLVERKMGILQVIEENVLQHWDVPAFEMSKIVYGPGMEDIWVSQDNIEKVVNFQCIGKEKFGNQIFNFDFDQWHPLNRMSAYKFFRVNPYRTSFQFDWSTPWSGTVATQAAPRTVGAFLERNFRYYEADNPERIDKRLLLRTEKMCFSLRQCLEEIEDSLRGGMKQFMDEQAGRE